MEHSIVSGHEDTPVHQQIIVCFILAFIAMSGIFYVNFLPSVVSALVSTLSFDHVQAGQIVAVNGYGSLTGSILAVLLIKRLAWRPAVLLSLFFMVIIDLGSAWLDSYNLMLTWRFVSGLFGGLVVGISFSVIARLNDPDRAFGMLLFLQFACGSLVIYLMPYAQETLGNNAVFFVMAGCALLALIFTCFLPLLALKNPKFSSDPRIKPHKKDAYLLLLTIVLYLIAANAIWAYVALIGQQTLLDEVRVNTYIACTGLLGLLGALWPVIHASRYGRLNWVIAGVVMSLVSAILFSFSHIPLIYIGAMALLFMAWPAVHSYLLAVSAQLDSSGQLSAIAAALSYFGLATGPMLAASLLEAGSFNSMLYVCAALFFLSLISLISPVSRSEPSQATE
ncbi:MFS transporter [Pseudoalteromonas sp. S16_S37]|uniref:MFS transporter n=1 Tax=Pseudoalteromonas sp. S16_S37 TaxID=2720228 RepID=UPI00168120E6|nr:MFS transporter [Pseudoalteromonas sp. S16_S37]